MLLWMELELAVRFVKSYQPILVLSVYQLIRDLRFVSVGPIILLYLECEVTNGHPLKFKFGTVVIFVETVEVM